MALKGFDGLTLLQRAVDYDEELTLEEWKEAYEFLVSTLQIDNDENVENAPTLKELKRLIDELEEEGDED